MRTLQRVPVQSNHSPTHQGHPCPLVLSTVVQWGLCSHLFAVNEQSKHIRYIFAGRSQEAACPSVFIGHA